MLDFCTLPSRGMKARSRSVDRSNLTSQAEGETGYATVRRGRQQVRGRCTSVERYADYDSSRSAQTRAGACAQTRVDVGAASGLQQAIASFEATLKQSKRDVTVARSHQLPSNSAHLPPRHKSSRCSAASPSAPHSAVSVAPRASNDVVDSFLNRKRESFAYKSLPRIAARPVRMTSQLSSAAHTPVTSASPCNAGVVRKSSPNSDFASSSTSFTPSNVTCNVNRIGPRVASNLITPLSLSQPASSFDTSQWPAAGSKQDNAFSNRFRSTPFTSGASVTSAPHSGSRSVSSSGWYANASSKPDLPQRRDSLSRTPLMTRSHHAHVTSPVAPPTKSHSVPASPTHTPLTSHVQCKPPIHPKPTARRLSDVTSGTLARVTSSFAVTPTRSDARTEMQRKVSSPRLSARKAAPPAPHPRANAANTTQHISERDMVSAQ